MSLEGRLAVDEREDTVALALTVTNVGDDQVELTFSDAQRADFAVLDDGTEVWRYGEGQMFAQMLGTEALSPGESVTFDGTWESPSPGEYEVVATLEANGVDLEVRETLQR